MIHISRLSSADTFLTCGLVSIVLFVVILIVAVWIAEHKKRLLRGPLNAKAVLRRPDEGVSESTQNAIGLARRVFSLAEFCAARGIVVYSLASHWSAFGSWGLELQTGGNPRDVSVFWDGFESYSFIEGADRRKIYEQKIRRDDDPIAIAQKEIAERLVSGDGESAQLAIDSMRPLVAFVEYLAAEDVAVSDLRSWGDRGWTLELRNGTNYDEDIGVVRVIWNRSEDVLAVWVSPVERHRAPVEFKKEFQRNVGGTDDPIAVAREYLAACFR